MARKGRKFELTYKWLYELDKKYRVKSPAYVYDKAADKKREIDVLVEYTDSNGYNRKIAIECRDRKQEENVMWIEQLIQKREDLELDYIIATTTQTFTKAAINKAKYHGVIIEQAEMFDSKTIENTMNKFFLDAFFFKIELSSMNFLTKNNKRLHFNDFFKTLDFAKQNLLLHELNTNLYFAIDPNEIIDDGKIKIEDFFSSENNIMEIKYNNILNEIDIPEFLNDIIFLDWTVRVIPFKITLPLRDSISVFNVETHSNKNYKAVYGNEEDYFLIGYLNGKLFTEIKFKQREYLRFARMNLQLNTIIPDDVDTSSMDQSEYIIENCLGKFDMSKLK